MKSMQLSQRSRERIEKVSAIAWAFFLIALPVTSFPYFPGGVGGDTLIRPLSVYPLMLLLVLVTLPRLFTRPLPRTFLPLLAFSVVALASSVLGMLYGVDALKGVSMAERLVRNLVTLGIGGAIYLTVALYCTTWEALDRSLRWLYAGFAIALLWGSLQAVYVIHYSPGYFKLLSAVQSFISTRRLFTTRISGLTYEPKWFAEQISFLLLPWLLGAIIQKRSAFQWRFTTPWHIWQKKTARREDTGQEDSTEENTGRENPAPTKRREVTVEMLLLGWAVGVLIFTYSRTGLFILLMAAFLSVLFAARQRREQRAISMPRARPHSRSRVWLQALLAVVVLGTVILLAGTQNRYFSRFWRYWTDENRPANKTYLEYIAVRQRLVYWETAYHIYEAYPWLGVGLGNYAFYFDAMLPDQPWNQQPEIIRQLTPGEGSVRLITPKNLYARLLAETGLVGTIVFTTFVIAVLGCALALWLAPPDSDRRARYWGVSGLLGMAIFCAVIFSFDSFAIPNFWVVFGLITAAAHIPRQEDLPNAEKQV